MNYVGYFYNTDKDVRECVFILPKVLLEDVEMMKMLKDKGMTEDDMKKMGM